MARMLYTSRATENICETIDDRSTFSREARGEPRNESTSSSPTATRVRLLCWIMTDPDDLENRVVHVKNTWAKRCDVTLFFSSKEDKDFPAIGLDVAPGRGNIAVKSRESWTYVFRHHFQDADFFLKADPDTYVLVENLRQYLSHCDPSLPEVFGHLLNYNNTDITYVSGAAMLLSREALRRLVAIGYVKFRHYIDGGTGEDLKNGLCLHEVGANFVDTRDAEMKQTFLPLMLDHHLFPTDAYIPEWYHRYRHSEIRTGKNCCSDYPVAFHYVAPTYMYLIDYLLRVGGYPLSESVDAEGERADEYRRRWFRNKVLMFRGTLERRHASPVDRNVSSRARS